MNNTTNRKFHNMSIEDREMFEYNSYREKQQAELARIRAQPEQPIKYCFQFLETYVGSNDDLMAKKCHDGIAKHSELLDYSEAHY